MTTPPWEIDGLPEPLVPADFVAAAEAWLMRSGVRVDDASASTYAGEVVQSVVGTTGGFTNCAGHYYAHNQTRIRRLVERVPMYAARDGSLLYPAILLLDPTPVDGDTAALAVISVEGYVGSAYGWSLVALARQVSNGLRPDADGNRRYWSTVTRVRDTSPEAWIPYRT